MHLETISNFGKVTDRRYSFLSGYNDMSILQVAQNHRNTNKTFLHAPFFSGAFVGKGVGVV